MITSKTIKQLAKKIGFSDCGISDITVSDEYYNKFTNWLSIGYNAEMYYLQNHQNIRKNPQLLVENAKSVISVIFNYYSIETPDDISITISKFALGKDYHKILKKKLLDLFSELKKICSEINGRVFVDTAPLFERYFAAKAGLGFIGKNNCLINETYGSWIFIGEIIVDVELEYDKPLNQNCDSCKKCIVSCPTKALTENCLDANKCISYHTVENKSEIPPEIKDKITTQIFGCDICQNVCPYNVKAIQNNNTELKILPQIKGLNYHNLVSQSKDRFKNTFSETSISRISYEKLLSNFFK